MSAERILVTGAGGLLGGYLVPELTGRELETWFVTRTSEGRGDRWLQCDLRDARAVADLWRRTEPTHVLHAAAITSVDLCEERPDLADAVHRVATENLARAARAAGARLLAVSTDSVFDGTRGSWREDDEPRPLNVYARTKLAGEQASAEAGDHLSVRTNFFGRSDRGHGLAEWLLRELGAGREVTGFADVVFSPLFCGDVAAALVDLLLDDAQGVVHLAARGAISKYDFALEVARIYRLGEARVVHGTLTENPLRAPRPLDTSLDNSRAEALLGRTLRTPTESVSAMHVEDGTVATR